jgi:hypothetical protein
VQPNRQRYRAFYKLEQHLELPMLLLSLVWLYLFIVELIRGLTPVQETVIAIIWALFIAEFALKLFLAPRKLNFLKHNWLTIISLLIPAFRILRVLNAFRILQSVRVINSTRIIRAITSGRRVLSGIKEAQGENPDPEVFVGMAVAAGQAANKAALTLFAERIAALAKPELETATGIKWNFDILEAAELEDDKARMPSEFLDMASFRMVEGPYDMINVITDVPLISRKNRSEPGLSSPVSRINVLTTRKLAPTGRNKELPNLDNDNMILNGTLLLLHLTGHLLGLKDTTAVGSRLMSISSFDQPLTKLPSFTVKERQFLHKHASKAPDREIRGGNMLERFIFHVLMTFRHFGEFAKPLLSSRALLLPLSLSGLVTAAVAPSLLLIFTAEIWDVGLGMTNGTATVFAAISIVSASFYLVRIQSLFLPGKEKHVLTEHLAVANATIYFSIFLACIGLFLMLCGLMLLIETYIFPPGLMQTWPTLDRPVITFADKLRLAVFISTIGVTTGALAGGLESRTIVQHLALFKSRT